MIELLVRWSIIVGVAIVFVGLLELLGELFERLRGR